MQVEITNLCSFAYPSILRDHSEKALTEFSWQAMEDELAARTPIFLWFLRGACTFPGQDKNKHKTGKGLLPGMLSAACKILSVRNAELSLLKYIVSILMLKGGAKKTLFLRLNSTGDYFANNKHDPNSFM